VRSSGVFFLSLKDLLLYRNQRTKKKKMNSPILDPPILEKARPSMVRQLSRGITNALMSVSTPRLRRAVSQKSSVQIRTPVAGTGLTTAQATATVVNTFVGLGLLSKPYAFQQGGIISILWLALIVFVMNYSGKAMIRCFKTSGKTDYPALGKIAFGVWGQWTVRIFVVLEFLGSAVTCIVLLCKNVELLVKPLAGEMTDDNRFHYKLVLFGSVCVACTPTVWMLNFGDIKVLSLLGSICSVLLSVSVVGCYLYKLSQGNAVSFHDADVMGQSDSTMVCLGIFILSMAGHAALPGVYAQMQQPEDFNHMLDISFFVIFLVYAVVAACGFYTYGDETAVVVTTNIESWPGGVIYYIVTSFVCFQIWTAISGTVQVLSEVPEEIMFFEQENSEDRNLSMNEDVDDEIPLYRNLSDRSSYFDDEEETEAEKDDSSLQVETKQRIFRTLLLWFVLAPLSFVCYGDLRLALTEAITGALCTMMTSLVLPCAILVVLIPKIKSWKRFVNIILVIFGVIFGVVMSYGDFRKAL